MKKIIAIFLFSFMVILVSCSKKEVYSEYNFELNEDGESYTLASLNDKNLKEIIIPSTYNDLPITVIGDSFFAYRAESIYISENIEKVYGDIFGGCRYLKKVEVSKDNKKYDSRNNCNAIVETHTNTLVAGCVGTIIPDDIEIIGYGAFYASKITEIDIPNSVHTIEDYAFSNSSIDYLIMPNSIKHIGEHAFYLCGALSYIRLSNNLESIGKECFSQTILTQLHIPKSVIEIGDGIIKLCKFMEKIEVDEDNDVYDSRENCNAIIETKTNKLIAGCRDTVIPNDVVSIGKGAISAYGKDGTFIIPSNIKVIEPYGLFVSSYSNPVLEFENKTGWYYINSYGEKSTYTVSMENINKKMFYQDVTIYCD